MTEFDKENEDVFQIVHDNPRRRGVIRDVGFIVPQEQAQQFAEYEAAQRHSEDLRGMAVMVIATLVVTVVALIR